MSTGMDFQHRSSCWGDNTKAAACFTSSFSSSRCFRFFPREIVPGPWLTSGQSRSRWPFFWHLGHGCALGHSATIWPSFLQNTQKLHWGQFRSVTPHVPQFLQWIRSWSGINDIPMIAMWAKCWLIGKGFGMGGRKESDRRIEKRKERVLQLEENFSEAKLHFLISGL